MSDQTKHTPGPWRVAKNAASIFAGKLGIAWVHPTEVHPTQDRPDRRQANARLIAASPELLETCEFVLNFLKEARENNWLSIEDQIFLDAELESKLQAAIAKVTGEQK